MTRRCYKCKKKITLGKTGWMFRGHWFCDKCENIQRFEFNKWKNGNGPYKSVY